MRKAQLFDWFEIPLADGRFAYAHFVFVNLLHSVLEVSGMISETPGRLVEAASSDLLLVPADADYATGFDDRGWKIVGTQSVADYEAPVYWKHNPWRMRPGYWLYTGLKSCTQFLGDELPPEYQHLDEVRRLIAPLLEERILQESQAGKPLMKRTARRAGELIVFDEPVEFGGPGRRLMTRLEIHIELKEALPADQEMVSIGRLGLKLLRAPGWELEPGELGVGESVTYARVTDEIESLTTLRRLVQRMEWPGAIHVVLVRADGGREVVLLRPKSAGGSGGPGNEEPAARPGLAGECQMPKQVNKAVAPGRGSSRQSRKLQLYDWFEIPLTDGRFAYAHYAFVNLFHNILEVSSMVSETPGRLVEAASSDLLFAPADADCVTGFEERGWKIVGSQSVADYEAPVYWKHDPWQMRPGYWLYTGLKSCTEFLGDELPPEYQHLDESRRWIAPLLEERILQESQAGKPLMKRTARKAGELIVFDEPVEASGSEEHLPATIEIHMELKEELPDEREMASVERLSLRLLSSPDWEFEGDEFGGGECVLYVQVTEVAASLTALRRLLKRMKWSGAIHAVLVRADGEREVVPIRPKSAGGTGGPA